MINDEYIINYFWKKQFNKKLLNNIPNDIYEYIINRYNDSSSILETLNRIKLNIEIVPKCPICGNPLKYKNNIHLHISPYESTCGSKECLKKIRDIHSKQSKLEKYGDEHYNNYEKNKQTKLERYGDPYFTNQEKREKTNLEIYGYKTPFQNKNVINKIVNKKLEKYGDSKYCNTYKIKQTKLERYGDPGYTNKEKIKQTKLERYGDPGYTNKEKYKQTCLEKYGVENGGGTEQSLEKIKNTILAKYGKEYFFQTTEFKNKFKETSLKLFGTEYPIQSNIIKSKIDYQKIVEKQIITKKKNNSFNKSNPEDTCYNLLCEKFNNVKRQYKSKEYPFNCDFYIGDINTYIEYQGFWTHGGHPFNPNDENDIKKLNIWKNKKSSFYKGAVGNWSEYDVKKRNITKENNLNYLEFFSINEFKSWIDKY